MGLKLILGNAGSGKSHRLFQHIIDESIKNPDRNYIIVVPEQFTLQTQKDIVRLHPKHGILNIDILSFKRLAIRIFEEVGFNNVKGTMIDDMGKNLILRHVAAAYEDMLPIMGKNIKKIGYISEVKSVISEMMQYNIGFEQLSGLIDYSQKQSLLKGKLQEIKVLYEAFLSYIKDRYVTGEELLDKAGSMVALSGRLKNSSIAFDGYTGFTPIQYKFIQALLENCIDVYDTVLIDVKREFLKNSKEVKANSEHELFYMSKMTIMKLKRLANESNIKIYPDEVIDSDFPIRYRMTKSNMEIDRKKADISGDNCDCTKRVNNRINKNLIHLENNLFRADAKKLKKSEESKISEEKELKEGAFYEKNDNESEKWIKKDIGIFSCQTMQDEITEVCKRLEELVRKKGYKYHEIAIVTGDIDGYSKILARKLQKFDIPYFIDKTIPILLNPCTEYIRAFFEVMINNYSYDSMIRYLRSQMTGIEPCEVDLFDNYLVAYGIKGRRSYFDKFTRKKSSYSAELLLRMDLVRERISKDFGLFEEGTAIGELRRTSKAKVKTFSKELYLLLKRKGMEKRLKELSQEFEKKKDSLKSKEMDQIYARVLDLLDRMVELIGDEEVSLEEYLMLLDAGFDEIRIGVIPSDQDYVQIGDITRSRLREIRALFLVGANDGIIPAAMKKGGIISDLDREFLKENDMGIEMAPGVRELAYTERLYLYMLMSKPSEKLFISFTKIAGDGASLKPSYIVKTIKDLFEEITVDYIGREGESPVFNELTGFDALGRGLQSYIEDFYEDRGEKEKKAAISYEVLLKTLLLNNGSEASFGLIRGLINEGIDSEREKKGSLDGAIASMVYGSELKGSVTRFEKYAACAFAHFVQYGLGLKEREEFTFEASDSGSLFHEALMIFGLLLKEEGLVWKDARREELESLAEEAVKRAIGRGEYGSLYSNYRSSYTGERIKRILKRTVLTLKDQLSKGDFTPAEFEYSFDSDKGDDSLNIKISDSKWVKLRGKIDRFDVLEEGNRVYVKIIDYKSSNKELDLLSVYAGMELQLLLYLNVAEERLKQLHSKDGKEVVPAGVFYYHIDDPMIDISDKEQEDNVDKLLALKLRMNGYVNEDDELFRRMDKELDYESKKSSDVLPLTLKRDGSASAYSKCLSTEDFKILSSYVKEKIRDMGKEILEGNIAPDPKNTGKNTDSCRFCSYSHICNYRPDISGEESDSLEGSEERGSDPLTKGRVSEAIKGKDELIELMRKKINGGN